MANEIFQNEISFILFILQKNHRSRTISKFNENYKGTVCFEAEISKGILHDSLSNFGYFRTSLCNISKPTDDMKEKDHPITFEALTPFFNFIINSFSGNASLKKEQPKTVVIPLKQYFHCVKTEEFSFCDHSAVSIHKDGIFTKSVETKS